MDDYDKKCHEADQKIYEAQEELNKKKDRRIMAVCIWGALLLFAVWCIFF